MSLHLYPRIMCCSKLNLLSLPSSPLLLAVPLLLLLLLLLLHLHSSLLQLRRNQLNLPQIKVGSEVKRKLITNLAWNEAKAGGFLLLASWTMLDQC